MYVCEVLAQEIDCKTPGTTVSREINRKLAQEYFLVNREEVMNAVEKSRMPDGQINPYGLTKELLSNYLKHIRSRIRA
jgi:hypothetical protein